MCRAEIQQSICQRILPYIQKYLGHCVRKRQSDFIHNVHPIYAYKTTLIQPLFIEVPILSLESEPSCI